MSGLERDMTCDHGHEPVDPVVLAASDGFEGVGFGLCLLGLNMGILGHVHVRVN
jgi:hypothetical protein